MQQLAGYLGQLVKDVATANLPNFFKFLRYPQVPSYTVYYICNLTNYYLQQNCVSLLILVCTFTLLFTQPLQLFYFMLYSTSWLYNNSKLKSGCISLQVSSKVELTNTLKSQRVQFYSSFQQILICIFITLLAYSYIKLQLAALVMCQFEICLYSRQLQLLYLYCNLYRALPIIGCRLAGKLPAFRFN